MPKIKSIDLENYPRRDHFLFFKEMAYPYVGLTAEVELTAWLAGVKERGQPFFLSFLYEVASAANAIPELRLRIKDGEIVECESCATSHTVMKPDGTWCFCRLCYDRPFAEFLTYALQTQAETEKAGNIEEDAEEALSLFFISSLPWLSYTALVQAVPSPADSNPRISWGKYFTREGKRYIPVSLLCHHALVDGLHIAKFYENLQNRLNG